MPRWGFFPKSIEASVTFTPTFGSYSKPLAREFRRWLMYRIATCGQNLVAKPTRQKIVEVLAFSSLNARCLRNELEGFQESACRSRDTGCRRAVSVSILRGTL